MHNLENDHTHTLTSVLQALCHCLDCRKISGSAYSTNLVVPGDGFALLAGSPKQISKTADSGGSITSHFCGDCGSTLWRDGDTFGPSKVIKAGVLDDYDALEKAAPGVELYAPHRPSWVQPVSGAAQKKSMPDSADA
jgi:hypothetical protein